MNLLNFYISNCAVERSSKRIHITQHPKCFVKQKTPIYLNFRFDNYYLICFKNSVFVCQLNIKSEFVIIKIKCKYLLHMVWEGEKWDKLNIAR